MRFRTGIRDELIGAVQDLTVDGCADRRNVHADHRGPPARRHDGTDPVYRDAAASAERLGVDRGQRQRVCGVAGRRDAGASRFKAPTWERRFPTSVADASLLTGGTDPERFHRDGHGRKLARHPSLITSVPNTVAAINGNNAQVRVIIDGSQTGGSTGLVSRRSHSVIRGLAIEGFGVGISIPDPTDVGDLIQGNFIGPYLAYPVDQGTGDPLPSPDTVILAGQGNTQEGIMLGSANATVGGFNPDENNVISGNGAQGVLLVPGTSGNQVLGNQIGVDRAVDERALFPGSATAATGCGSSRPARRAIPRASSIRRAT